MYLFLNGVTAAGCIVVSIVFFRMWRQSEDQLFSWFSVAFALFALERLVLSVMNQPETANGFVYLLRLAGFLCILAAIVWKNVPRRS